MSSALELPSPLVSCCMCRGVIGTEPFMTALQWRGKEIGHVPFHLGCFADLVAQRVVLRTDEDSDDDDEEEDDGPAIVIDMSGGHQRSKRRGP